MSGLLSGLLGNGNGNTGQSGISVKGRPGDSIPGSTGQSILINSRKDSNGTGNNGSTSRGNSTLFRLFEAASNPVFHTIPDHSGSGIDPSVSEAEADAASAEAEVHTSDDRTSEPPRFAKPGSSLLLEVSPSKAHDVAQEVHRTQDVLGTTGPSTMSPWFLPSDSTLDRFEFLYEDVLVVSRFIRTP
jgi:hypothetical protein